jgi:hypothetical protein
MSFPAHIIIFTEKLTVVCIGSGLVRWCLDDLLARLEE